MTDRGNFIAEWFGHRIYPKVASSPAALADLAARRCPFLSMATQEERECIKPRSSLGVCTISSASNGPRQDWLVCPYRALKDSLFLDVVDRLFPARLAHRRVVVPAPALLREEVRSAILEVTDSGGGAIVYLQNKLGGEISIPRTDRSPELSFDITLVEITRQDDEVSIPRYGILEVQTMDFHGSYRHAVQNLEDALRLHGESFAKALDANQQWAGEKIEGPNIANVFKRTFYQMMLKFQIGSQGDCAGCVLALPAAVWDSWQRHLAAPDLKKRPDGNLRLGRGASLINAKPPAWIYVFDIDSTPTESPSPIEVRKRIATNADTVARLALKVAPDAAMAQHGPANLVTERIKRRLATWWPELWCSPSSQK